MADITGVVQEIQTRDVSGGKKAYNIVVGGQDYGVGLYPPKCKVGDYVKFELDESRGYKNVGRNSLKVSSNKPPAEALAAAEATKPKPGGGYDSKQDVIARQAAANTAIAFLQVAAATDSLGLPAASAKGKRLETLEAMFHEYQQQFYEENTGIKWKSINPNAKDEAAPSDAEPTAEEPADSEWQ